MNNLRNTVPVILIIWPYLLVFCLFLPGYRFTLPFYAFFTAIVYIFNIWNAWTYPYGETRRDLIFWNMLVKLIHIPFYAGVFALGCLMLLAMAVPAFLLVSPVLLSILATTDICLMLTTSMYGISAVVRLRKEGRISSRSALLHIILHLFFVTDVVSAVCLFYKSQKRRMSFG